MNKFFKDFKTVSIVLIVSVAVILLVNLLKDIYIGRIQNDLNNKTDTIYVDKYLPGKTEYKYITVPKEVIIYKDREVIKWDTLKTKGDTITIYKKDSILIEVKTNFLLLYPENPKLIGFDLNNKEVSLDLLSKQGKEYTEKYNINTLNNSYRYINNKMTVKPKLISGFNISGEYYFRPLINYHDLNINLNLKTGKFTYIGGLNTYYYPSIENKLNYTPVVGIRYIP